MLYVLKIKHTFSIWVCFIFKINKIKFDQLLHLYYVIKAMVFSIEDYKKAKHLKSTSNEFSYINSGNPGA